VDFILWGPFERVGQGHVVYQMKGLDE
jgi:hypothetical protein